MRFHIFLFIFCLCMTNSMLAQKQNYPYAINIYGGWLYTLSPRGPHDNTDVSKVKFIRPFTKTLGFSFDIEKSANLVVGLEFFYDEFDYGYKAEKHFAPNASVGIESGLEGANDRVALYKLGIRAGYLKKLTAKCQLKFLLIPSIGYYPYSSYLKDTSENADFRNGHSEILYQKYPSYENSGLKFLLKTGVQAIYKLGQHLDGTLTAGYQFGFTPFVIDSVNIIRPYEPTGVKEHVYWTKVTGSSLQCQAALQYNF